jgi:CBS domain-containing protein
MTPPTRQLRDIPLGSVLRKTRPVGPQTRLADALELLRVAPQRAVPVVENGRLIGILSDREVVGPLLENPGLRDSPVVDFAAPIGPTVSANVSAAEFLALCDAHQADFLPVVEGSGYFSGLISRGDLLDALARPGAAPLIGGMATPAGVYLTAGAVTGGVHPLALSLTGLLMFSAQVGIYLALDAVGKTISGSAPKAMQLLLLAPEPVRRALDGVGSSLASGLLFLSLVRLSPLAGYHAAEHQVVHAIERGEPLLPECVREMPREHPRCGTNFIAGALLFSLGGALTPILGALAYPLGGLAALAWWRTLGGWLQRHFTTRIATAAQLDSGIRAGREVLTRYARSERDDTPLLRLWNSGMIHLLLGFFGGAGILALLAQLPLFRESLTPMLRELLAS